MPKAIVFPAGRTIPSEEGNLQMQKYNYKFLRAEELADWLELPVRTVTELACRWKDTGGLEGIPGFKIGRAWRFDEDQVKAWPERNQKVGGE